MVIITPLIWVALAQGPAGPLSGTVVGPGGEPVAGADLFLAGVKRIDGPIVVRGKSDERGGFSMARPVDPTAPDRTGGAILWVVKPGFRLSRIRLPGPAEPLRVALQPPGKGEVRVIGPDGEPVVGARVRLERFGVPWMFVPEPVEDLVEATTDREGRAVLDAAANDEIAYVDVHSRFGIQGRPFYPQTAKPRLIRLRPAASLRGRLVADDAAMVKGWEVRAYTRTGDPNVREPATTGFGEGTTDEQGRFAFPAIAGGALQLELKPPRDLPVLADFPTSVIVSEGRENAIEVPLRKAATVTGSFVERATGRPIPGVQLYYISLQGLKTLDGTTDAAGRYSFPSLPGRARLVVFRTPPTHAVGLGQRWDDFNVPDGGGRVELGPRELVPAAPPLRFVVRDETGRPAAHATVIGQSESRYMPKTTDANGEFRVPGVAPGGRVTIEVRQGERMTEGPVEVLAGGTDPVPITIRPGLVLELTGRVVGPGGTPVANAAVKIRYREQKPQGGRFPFPHPVEFGDRSEVHTGPDGSFRTPREIFGKNREFRVEAAADGFLAGHTDWIPSTGGDRLVVPDLSLRRERTLRFVSGRVIDRQGRGVAGAAVFQSVDASRPTATADADGRFRLAEVPSAAALVFAEKAGFRFGGTVAAPGDGPVEIRLARVEEPPLSIPAPRPSPLSRAEERAMAKELLAPLIAGARSGSLGHAGQSVIPALARVDPDRVLAMIENRAVSPSADVLDRVALAQLESDPAAAIATIDADHNPGTRAGGLIALADALPDGDRERRMAWLDRALDEARRVEDRPYRLELLGQIADRWLDLGALDRATPILREGRALLDSLPRDRYSYGIGNFAEVLAVIDLPAARDVFERKGWTNFSPPQPSEIQNHLADAALRLAAFHPAEAERLIPAMGPTFPNAKDYVLRVCQRMARADLPRARRILEQADRPAGPGSFPTPAFVPEGLGLMASGLAATDPGEARRLLDEAFEGLRAASREASGRDAYANVACMMAGLLPVVERIDADRLRERLWQSAACSTPLAEQPSLNPITSRIILATLVARYDRDMAAALIAPAMEQLPQFLTDSPGNDYGNGTLLEAVAAYDPRAVSDLLRALPESARKAPDPRTNSNAASLDAQVRLAAARMLGLPPADRHRIVFERHLGLRPLRWIR